MQEVIGSTPIFSTILIIEEEIFDILTHKTVSKDFEVKKLSVLERTPLRLQLKV